MHITPKNILLVKNRGMGDAIMGLSSLRYLRLLFPAARISYAVPAWIAPLFTNLQTDADEIFPLQLQNFSSALTTWHQLQCKKIDLIFELHLAGRSYKFFRLLSIIHRIPYFYHNHHLAQASGQGRRKIKDQGVIRPLIQRDLDGLWSLLRTFSGDLSMHTSPAPSYLDFAPRLGTATPVSSGLSGSSRPLKLVLGVVATRETKMWPLVNFVQFAQLMYQWNRQWQLLIPLSANAADQEINGRLSKYFGTYIPPNVQIIEQNLAELPAQLADARWYLGNDTGLKHLCLALGARTLTLFGPEPPYEWHPYDVAKHPYFYLDDLACRTATAHYCGLSKCASMICLQHFSAETVFNRFRQEVLADSNK